MSLTYLLTCNDSTLFYTITALWITVCSSSYLGLPLLSLQGDLSSCSSFHLFRSLKDCPPCLLRVSDGLLNVGFSAFVCVLVVTQILASPPQVVYCAVTFRFGAQDGLQTKHTLADSFKLRHSTHTSGEGVRLQYLHTKFISQLYKSSLFLQFQTTEAPQSDSFVAQILLKSTLLFHIQKTHFYNSTISSNRPEPWNISGQVVCDCPWPAASAVCL